MGGGLGNPLSLGIGELFWQKWRRARSWNSLAIKAEEEVCWKLRGFTGTGSQEGLTVWKREREDFGKEMEGPRMQDRKVKRKIGRKAKEFASREKQKGMTSENRKSKEYHQRLQLWETCRAKEAASLRCLLCLIVWNAAGCKPGKFIERKKNPPHVLLQTSKFASQIFCRKLLLQLKKSQPRSPSYLGVREHLGHKLPSYLKQLQMGLESCCRHMEPGNKEKF